MGFRYKGRLIADVLGRTFITKPDGTIERYNSSSFTQAFPDTLHANRAADGVYHWVKQFTNDPQLNYVDFLEPDVSLSGSDTFGPNEALTWTDGTLPSTTLWPRSGDTALKVNDTSTIGLAHCTAFRISAGRAYRMTVRWLAGTGAQRLRAGVNCFKPDYSSGGSFSFFTELGSFPACAVGDNFQYDSFIFTAGSTDTFARVFVGLESPGADSYLVVDEILIEPLVEGFYAYRSSNDTTTWTAGAVATVIYNSEVYDYGGQYSTSTGTFTCSVPGRYTFHASAGLDAVAAAEEIIVEIRQNGNSRMQTRINASSGAENLTGHVSTVLECARGDTITCVMTNGDTLTRTMPSSTAHAFTGSRIG